MAYKAIIAGASGLIGSKLLEILLQKAQYSEVLVLVRKELPVSHPKLVQLVINFDELDKHAAAITGHVVFSCLGTTKAQTPDKNEYRKIDHDYPVKLAQLARQNGVKHFHLISAVGANENSSNSYLKLKGEVERDVEKVGLPVLHIYRPSMLVGERKDRRIAETIINGLFKVIDPLLVGGLKKYQSIKAPQLAWAMFKKSLDNAEGTFIHTTDKIKLIK
ncbi:NAD-dependent epimerase/dehydratase family protein [Mucilaginibacter achroorhodeus]|uniref:NAD-dependent epimerase/dehydratase family protein n=1 Tax=Mucilaginibacter achroorhodeus TaxID=2599294 RepID=A0A563TY97_9SPHI|nr:NAD(P)H-binding protein [Mucilaginibacter achroorhodeus]TWR24334.1 NAD-dependent epimerase/dehydratase family protein [Mucilaginibacter achroorhodeus]